MSLAYKLSFLENGELVEYIPLSKGVGDRLYKITKGGLLYALKILSEDEVNKLMNAPGVTSVWVEELSVYHVELNPA